MVQTLKRKENLRRKHLTMYRRVLVREKLTLPSENKLRILLYRSMYDHKGKMWDFLIRDLRVSFYISKGQDRRKFVYGNDEMTDEDTWCSRLRLSVSEGVGDDSDQVHRRWLPNVTLPYVCAWKDLQQRFPITRFWVHIFVILLIVEIDRYLQ